MELLFKILDNYFRQNCPGGLRCISLPVSNKHNHVIFIAFFLSRGISFYLSSQKSNNKLPAFTDYILDIGAENDDGHDITSGLALNKNSSFAGNNQFKKGESLIFFSSSGSTGAPKFICYPATNITRNARNCINFFSLSEKTKILISVPVYHMYGFGVGLLPGLLCNAKIKLVEQANIVKLYQGIDDFLPDYVLITPALIRMMLTVKFRSTHKCTFITAGERITEYEYIQFRERFGKLVNIYGCSEMGAMAASVYTTGDGIHSSEALLSAMPGVVISIAQKPRGEILCRSDAGFSYYVDNDGEQLTNPPYTDGWYHTRDLGEWVDDYSFLIAGRIDNCINLSGFLTCLSEIELAVEKALPEARRVVVLESANGSQSQPQLVAICETEQETAAGLTATEVRKRCRKLMPSHIIPGQFHFISKLPLLENGKADIIQLKENYS
jgi:acyl-coenzyme A synthetase/AMP-(fatty) acid ligase